MLSTNLIFFSRPANSFFTINEKIIKLGLFFNKYIKNDKYLGKAKNN